MIHHTPESRVRRGILIASSIPSQHALTDAARVLGNGSLVTAPDTVPFCIWIAAQQRKPMIGSRSAWPVAFRHPNQGGSLLIATDGLLKYTPAARIIELCRQHATESAAQRLVELVRYPSGELPDDVTLILTNL